MSDDKTPFEIMGRAGRSTAPRPREIESPIPARVSPTTAAEPLPNADPDDRRIGIDASGADGRPFEWSSLWRDASRPITVFLPRGVAVLLGLAVLLGVLLAYRVGLGVGRDKGYDDGVSETIAQINHNIDTLPIIVGGADAGELTQAMNPDGDRPAADPGEPVRGRIWALSDGDPREPGLNYLHVGAFNEADSVELATFFAGSGVDVAVVPTENAQLFRVAVLKSALPRADYQQPEVRQTVEREVLAVYRAFVDDAGAEDTLQDMLYWDRHGD